MGITKMSHAGVYSGYDTLHLHHNAKKASAYLAVYTLVDRDTKQFILYSPTLDVSGYGETEEKAREIFKSSVNYMFEHLTSMPLKKCTEELNKLGWKTNLFNKKDFTKAADDITEQAQIFNADIKNVQHINIAA